MIRLPAMLCLVTLASFLTVSLPNAGADQAPRERQVLTVSATGTERIDATVADVRLAIEERGLTDEEARERMARRSNRLLDYLREQGVDRLKTSSLRLHPIYDYTKGTREIVGFQAMSVIEFRSDAADVAHVIDEAIARGANQVQNLVFTAPEETIEEARQRALRAATRLALDRADVVLEELGLERQRIVRIRVDATDTDPPFIPFHRMESRAMAADRSPTDVEAGQPEVQASVTLEIGY